MLNKKHNRKSIRLREYNYSDFGYYFITICTHQRKILFGKIIQGKMQLNELGLIVHKEWLNIPNNYQVVELDKFIIMPNHLHGIIIINNASASVGAGLAPALGNISTPHKVGAIHELPLRDNQQSKEQHRIQRRQMLLPKIIGKFKMNSAKQINIILNSVGQPVWQRNYYEHIIRDDKDYGNIWDYIDYNPDKWEWDRNNPKNL